MSSYVPVSKMFMQQSGQLGGGSANPALDLVLSLQVLAHGVHLRARCSEAGDLLDEDGHLLLLDGAGAVLVELTEALVKVFVVEASAISHVGERVLDELLGLLLVQETVAVIVVLVPDFLHALGNHSVNFAILILGHLCLSFLLEINTIEPPNCLNHSINQLFHSQ